MTLWVSHFGVRTPEPAPAPAPAGEPAGAVDEPAPPAPASHDAQAPGGVRVRPLLRIVLAPGRIPANRRVGGGYAPAARAVLTVAGRTYRTNRRGAVRLIVRFAPGTFTLRARAGKASARRLLRVR